MPVVIETNKIRMTFIESEMAKRYRGSPAAETISNDIEMKESDTQDRELRLPQRQPATLGKLHEIDLGPDAKLRNIERTVAATRSLAGGDPLEPNDQDLGGKKPRLNKDGKPWRQRKRRNSEDIRRDQLVEEVLRESKRRSSS